MDLILKKISNYVNSNEDFSEKLILTINLEKKYGSKGFVNIGKILNVNKIFLEKNLNDAKNVDEYQPKIKFDFVFVYNSSLKVNQKKFNKAISSFEKYFKNGTRVIVFYENRQNFSKYFKRIIVNKFQKNSLLKKENLNNSSKYKVYDYFFFSYHKNKNLKILSFLIYKLISFINLLDLQRCFFISSNIMVKYLYLK